MHITVCHGTHSSDTALKNTGENTVPFVEVRTGVNPLKKTSLLNLHHVDWKTLMFSRSRLSPYSGSCRTRTMGFFHL